MLFQVGAVAIDVRPFNIDSVEREGAADFADKDLLGRRKGSEAVGIGTETLQLKGTVLPFRRRGNGLPALETQWGQMRAQEPVFVLRGDGMVMGWMRIDSIKEAHSHLAQGGVGHEMTRVAPPGGDAMLSQLDQLLSLFG
jgi:phage protein U